MTLSIVARDPDSGRMGVASTTQALAVGSSVPWALPGYGVIASQSMGEPMYGELGLDVLRSGLTAPEALAALRSVDPYPERRQVAMVDTRGNVDVATGRDCVAAAGHATGDGVVTLANMVAGPEVWEAMLEAYRDAATAALSRRLHAALVAGVEAGGDVRGERSASLLVVADHRSGRPWRDQIVDLRVDDDADPVGRLDGLLSSADRYHVVVSALEQALDGQAEPAAEDLDEIWSDACQREPDLRMWRGIVLGLAGREDEGREVVTSLCDDHPGFVEVVRRMADTDVVPDPDVLRRLLPDEA